MTNHFPKHVCVCRMCTYMHNTRSIDTSHATRIVYTEQVQLFSKSPPPLLPPPPLPISSGHHRSDDARCAISSSRKLGHVARFYKQPVKNLCRWDFPGGKGQQSRFFRCRCVALPQVSTQVFMANRQFEIYLELYGFDT